MTRTIIIEDDPLSVEIISDLLIDKFPSIEIAGVLTSAQEAHKLIDDIQPDLVFLDIELPGMSGIELIKSMGDYFFDIIFTTAHKEFGAEAFKVNAIDFLLKPLCEIDLREALRKFDEKKKLGAIEEHINAAFAELSNKICPFKRIGIPTVNGLEFIEVSQITRLQANINYTNIYLVGGRKICISKTLKEFEPVLRPYGFCRVHQSHLVNLRYVKSYTRGNGGTITLDELTEIDVSKGYKDRFLKSLSVF